MTRAALITPPGPAGIAVLKISGPQSPAIIQQIFQSQHQNTASHALRLGQIIDPHNNDIIDQVVLDSDLDTDPPSCEINCHGGPRIVQRLLILLRQLNVTIVPWQQLTTPTTIAQEVNHILPQAKTPLVVRAIAAQHPKGLTAWLKQTIQQLSANPQSLPAVQSFITNHLLPTYPLTQKLLSGFTVVFTGPPNVGKSTLANALTGKTQSLVADLPGTTRDWTNQLTTIASIPINIIDTAGRRPTNDPIESQSLAQAQPIIESADAIVLILDITTNPSAIQHHLNDLPKKPAPLVVLNKSDLASNPNPPHLTISALNRTNLPQLQSALITRLNLNNFNPTAPRIFTPRQHNLLQKLTTNITPTTALSLLNQLNL
ncbi:MAG: 50S ribosome-binding GTPase [Sedimentisphaerales bacterium]|nr:50S ribosome-binding GTPase [Sedimentisphaerales bacterium]